MAQEATRRKRAGARAQAGRARAGARRFGRACGAALAAVLLCACAEGGREAADWPQAVLYIGAQRIQVQVADTPARRARGLSGRAGLAPGRGVYFPFEKADLHSFWMKDMHFDIDIIWLRENRIVHMEQRVPHAVPPPPPALTPGAPADAVLEVPAGSAARWGWRIGDPVRLSGWKP
ncbi:MAG: DUF192 domain-containing protein [Deltaproteobacteria bacterium]|nr:DUF192 domain-containing protein [Deltaproteobacteria bacterium]